MSNVLVNVDRSGWLFDCAAATYVPAAFYVSRAPETLLDGVSWVRLKRVWPS